jgi:hypothetical protein
LITVKSVPGVTLAVMLRVAEQFCDITVVAKAAFSCSWVPTIETVDPFKDAPEATTAPESPRETVISPSVTERFRRRVAVGSKLAMVEPVSVSPEFAIVTEGATTAWATKPEEKRVVANTIVVARITRNLDIVWPLRSVV